MIWRNDDINDEHKPSRLYHLPPIASGTSQVESLTSYVTRLAYSHRLKLSVLITQLVIPEITSTLTPDAPKPNRTMRISLNGVGSKDEQPLMRWIEALQALTLRPDLIDLTLYKWRNVIAPHRLLRRERAWCPLCFADWLSNEQVLYEPLMWSIAIIEHCPIHHCKLTNRCARCGNIAKRFVNDEVVGYCSACHAPLDTHHETDHPAVSDEESEAVQHVGSLLAMSPRLQTMPATDAITAVAALSVHHIFGGNHNELARWLKITPTSSHRITNGPYTVQLNHLIRLAGLFDLDLADLITYDAGEVGQLFSVPVKPVIATQKFQQGRKHDHEKIEKTLQRNLRKTPPPTLKAAAKEAGCQERYLHKHFPDQARVIVENYRIYRNTQIITQKKRSQPKRTLDRAYIEQQLKTALEENPPRTQKEVAQSLGYHQSNLRKHFSELCSQIAARYDAHKKEQIRLQRAERSKLPPKKRLFDYDGTTRLLNEALEENPPPTLTAVAERMGYGSSNLAKKQPELCAKIAQRYADYKAGQQQQRQAALAQRVRDYVYELHRQGITPTRYLLAQYIGGAFRNPVARRAFTTALVELGYTGA